MASELTRRRLLRGTFAACLGVTGCGESTPGVRPKRGAITIVKDGEKTTARTRYPTPKQKKGKAKR